MLFNSLIFWGFFVIFAFGFWNLKGNCRNFWSLIASYIFYGWWDWRFLGLIALLTGLNYWFGLEIAKQQEKGSLRSRRWITASVLSSLGILGFFKYFNFFVESAENLLAAVGMSADGGTLNIILPVGISFYTFQAMSYTLDLYRREIEVERSILRFATFVAFFPQLVAGPIVRAAEFLPQLRRDSVFSWSAQVEGACVVAWGMVLKVVLADSLAPVVDTRFSIPEAITALSLLIGVLCYAFQIYGDFAGYSLMAIGFAHSLGYQFNRNFDRPYFAVDFSDFWRRWHISLSSWLRDYLYIPLGGNRKGPVRTYINLLLTMLLGGLWHGAAWTFIIWGGLHGLYLCCQRALSGTSKRLPITHPSDMQLRLSSDGEDVRKVRDAANPKRGLGAESGVADGRSSFVARFAKNFLLLLRIMLVFVLVCVAWIFFRARSVDEGWLILQRIVAAEDMSFAAVEQKFQVLKALGLIIAIVVVEAISFRVSFWEVGRRWPVTVGLFLIMCLLAISVLGNFTGNAFVYFQF